MARTAASYIGAGDEAIKDALADAGAAPHRQSKI